MSYMEQFERKTKQKACYSALNYKADLLKVVVINQNKDVQKSSQVCRVRGCNKLHIKKRQDRLRQENLLRFSN